MYVFMYVCQEHAYKDYVPARLYMCMGHAYKTLGELSYVNAYKGVEKRRCIRLRKEATLEDNERAGA